MGEIKGSKDERPAAFLDVATHDSAGDYGGCLFETDHYSQIDLAKIEAIWELVMAYVHDRAYRQHPLLFSIRITHRCVDKGVIRKWFPMMPPLIRVYEAGLLLNFS